MTITPYGLNTTSQAAQTYNNISGATSLDNEVKSVGPVIENPIERNNDSVTIQSNQSNQKSVSNTLERNLEETSYASLGLQTKGELQTLTNRLNSFETVNTTNEVLRNEGTETAPPPPEIEAPPPETSGTTQPLERENNFQNSTNFKTVIPIATNEINGLNNPQVQVTTTGVYTNNSGVAIQASLSVPFTVDQTV